MFSVRPFATTFLAILLLAAATSMLRAQDRAYSVTIFGSFTTSSKLFHHPNDADQFVRSQFLPLNDLFSGGIDVRRHIEHVRVQVGLSIEYIRTVETFRFPLTNSFSVPVRDGFTVIPIEVSGYFLIPVGNENIRLFMGGGGGAYFGYRLREFAGESSETVGRTPGYGIHIVSGLQYSITPSIALRSELKFRDMQFEATNKFSRSTTTYAGSVVPLPNEPFPARINVDGMTLNLGLVYSF